MRQLLWICLALFCLILPVAHADDPQPVPSMDSLVVDPNGVLGYSQQRALNQKLLDYQRRQHHQMAVLIVSTTRPEDVFSYGLRVARDWRLGHSGDDDGVLLLVATDDHADNIQVGYGLENALPNALCRQILQETVAPFFRHADYYSGINAGVDAVMSATATRHFWSGFRRSGGWMSYFGGFFTGLGAALVLALLAGRLIGGITGALIGGAVAFGLGAAVPAVLMIAAALFMLMQPGAYGSNAPYGRSYRNGYNDGRRNNDSDWGGGSGSSGGGSSGDGGGFGGGGASGSW